MQTSYRVLAVDDEESILKLLERELNSDERIVHTAKSAQQARKMVAKNEYDVLILDIKLPDGDGLDLFTEFKAKLQDIEIILITGHGDIDSAVEAMRIGAYDYITKPFKLDRLELVLDRAFQRVWLQRENKGLRHTHEASDDDSLIGKSDPIKHIRFLIGKLRPSEIPLLITGESGAGKDVVARTVHSQSKRASHPLIIKNCAMLQRELVRSELFGHRKGAFTGASEAREGLISLAHKGTLFLDEIGDLPEDVQASLLRVIETKTYRRMGENEERRADVRFLFATNRNLAKAVENGQFNEALFHRINVFNIHIPRLKKRKEDIPLLVAYFLGRLSGGGDQCVVADKAMQLLLSYDWPGNVRELRNVLERALILTDNNVITDQALPKEILNCSATCEDSPPPMSLETVEKEHILRILSYYDNNKQKASEVLGIGRKTLYRKILKYGIES
ncbi:sigma-54-dependent transcriptional regulator [Pseudodesulfovibrio piezophilus]|uniref:Two component, sigma54 specific, transcriptional regulator, Fis family n=1 Tax=Pseudodesulfovibrio piezophilus (strain DSM 21447 / JCM 15486 / C1TLV30) TaxID=1322246 RepID=M1WK71_PSEP2|nr:sigma-54 dependent transcriptional regulator [Pseudodesulfovibrio piezophilus]CCH49091.1 Two component, sigma54 specific, transcriptional regulator, Fis family [Pseudodesulfovibrio piezophilus C1TLV30]